VGGFNLTRSAVFY